MKIDELVDLVRTLRSECPWDKTQTLKSLKNKVIEEAYELVYAIEQENTPATIEEIGDIIFLALFLARILEQEGKSSLDLLIESTAKKYREKHPHVFKDKDLKDKDAVLEFWHKSKRDIFEGIPGILPALLASKVIQERASKLGFDWSSHTGPLEKVHEEISELEKSAGAKRSEELGDLLFACVNLARHLEIDPEDALRHANEKFVARFRKILGQLKKQGKDIEQVTLEEMDRIWDEIKKDE
jgi:tetrapyrrole methylase family protein/MazG family protein